MTATQHTHASATAEYVAQHARAMDLLMRLQSAVCDCPAPDGGTTITWGHVGSLGELNRQLDEALAFIES
jgi:hypothetical protein